ncbi:MAG TPA: hypothetical protein VFL80_01910 [Thermoanaerobaculia bacterium]|nr:hypothetical protein [Thermoanaerobaculia bacterium]
MGKDKQDEIDYRAEGDSPPAEKEDSTNAGYDEAVRSGSGAYGVAEGEGGVFGTSGGGTYEGGMHVEERPAVYEGGGDDSGRTSGARGVTRTTPGAPDDDPTLRLPRNR